MKPRKTLVDVATAAGVSKMTASRALRGDKDVSKANVSKVRQAARDIGYSGNPLAASLSRERTDLIGVVVPSLSNIVFPQVMSGITQALAGTEFQPVLGVTDYDTDKEHDVLRSILSWRPSGLIVTGLDQPNQTRSLLEQADIPIIQIMDLDGDPIDGCVGFSHTEAGRDMAAALIAAGRKRFGYVGCNLDKDHRAAKRKQGFVQGLRERGLELVGTVCQSGGSSVDAGRRLASDLLAAHADLDCIYFSNDDLAVGGLGHCIGSGISVPEQVALAGFNGLDVIQAFPETIATSRTARKGIGEVAAQIMLDQIKTPMANKDRRVSFRPEILLGALSTAQTG